MPHVKYYETIKQHQTAKTAKDDDKARGSAPASAAGKLAGRIVTSLLARHFFWTVLRAWFPILRVGQLCIVSRYDDVKEVRQRHDVFEVPYGLEMTELAGGANFLLGMQHGPAYERQRAFIQSAFAHADVQDIITTMSASLANELVESGGGEIDAVQGLATRVAAEVCIGYFGLDADDPHRFADWLMAISSLLFADLFGDRATRRAALLAARQVRAVLSRSIAQAKAGRVPANTVIARLVGQRRTGADGPSDDEITAILMGLAVGFVPTTTLAAGHILEVLFSNREAMRQAQAAARTNEDERLERCLMEAMRFKPPIIPGLPRYAKARATIAEGTSRETSIPEGTTVVTATMSAMLDPDRVARAREFDPERSLAGDLLFGGRDLVHHCLGEQIAKALITNLFKPLLRQKGLRRAAGRAGRLKKVGPFPQHMRVVFDAKAGQRDQSLVTICVPISPSDVLPAQEEIAKLGNPAAAPIRDALSATQRVHFASMLAVRGDAKNGEPSYLVVELNVDGPEGSAIKAVVEHVGQYLLPVFKIACGVEQPEELEPLLLKHVVHLRARPWDGSGLNFCGTPELPVTQITKDQDVASRAREHLRTWVESHGRLGSPPIAALRFVRTKLRAEKLDWAMVRPLGLQLAVSRRTDLGTVEAIKSLVTDRPFITKLVGAVLAAALAHLLLAADGMQLISDLWAGEYAATALPIVGRLISSLFYGSMFLGAGLSAAIGVLIWLLRRKEERDVAEDLDPNHRAVATLMEAENTPGYVQNHLTAVTRLKPGWFRRLTLATAFWGIEKLVQHRFRPGFVLDIGSIHFARWLRLPGTNTLVFFSNYDGSWESYLEDFITKAHLGQTSVWSNGIGFPRTRYLMLDGAKDGNRFKRWVRRQQVSTSFWYSRFPTLTTDQIRNNALICHGLANARTDSDARAWLELFNSQPRPTEALEMHEIQSLAFGGMGKLPVAELIALRFPASLDRCATWIRDIMSLNGDGDVVADGGRAEPAAVPLTAAYEPSFGVAPRVSFGDVMPDDRAMIVALSASGLRRLGLDRMGLDEHGDALSSFPAAFVEGMAGPIRSRILADEGDSAPDKWQWGSPHSMPDAVLLLYAGTHGQLVEARARELMSLRKHGLEVLSTIPLEVGKGQVEPFGFRDGVSQPIIRGTRRFNLGANPIHVVEPGEFVLGYPDNRGKYPPTPVIAAGHDTDCCLPSTPERLPGRFPAFAATQVDMSRDFGRNGSFLVIRQLEQDVPGFQAFLKQAAADLQSRYRGLRIDEDWVASKMIGRWRNGSSLARHPHSAGTVADNDFWLGVDDPQGLRCPYGAHVRRANPRDSFHPGSREQLEISNRHRLLRVGRPYGEVADEPEANSPRFKAKGLMFMCLNADIERQFEFVQQTWVSSRSFHGLTNEVDPVAGSCPGGGMFTIPTPAGPIELKVPQSFVTVRGGGYFFLPSRSALRFLCSVGA